MYICQNWGATFEFVERLCKWSKTAIISMFISAAALFVLMLKFKIDHHHVELYLLCRWAKGLCVNIGNGRKYIVFLTVGVRIFPGDHFFLMYYYRR
jgi:hypothetical protein